MDLIAVVTEDERVQVYRLNGQKVFTAPTRRVDVDVTAICWKPNGRVLLVAHGDGALLLVSTYTGKQINLIESRTSSRVPVSCLAWSVNFTDPSAARSLLESKTVPPGAGVAAKKAVERGGLLDEALAKGLRALDIEVPLDLPAELRNLEVEASLPKLSVLPASGASDDAFSTRASIDTIFHTAKKDSNELADLILLGFADGKIHLSIYDFFELGDFSNGEAWRSFRVVSHCSHPYSSTHGLFLQSAEVPKMLSFVPMDLKLITDHGQHLSLLASKSSQMQNILRYMKSTVGMLCAEFKSSQDLPRKFMRNAEEDLQEKDQISFANAIYHLAATGMCSPILKEWLTDQIGDRGHKRWEKAALSGYEGICRYTLQNLIPSVDRLVILVIRLRGLARFYESSTSLGLSIPQLDLVLDTADCVKFLAHRVLQIASDELLGFVAFSNWMKLEIEVQNTDPTSATTDDFPPKYSAIDYTSLLDYIHGPMQESRLVGLCSDDKNDHLDTPRIVKEGQGTIYAEVKRQSRSHDKRGTDFSLVSMLSRLEKQCQTVFTGIAAALRRKVRFGSRISIHDQGIEQFDSTVTVAEQQDAEETWHATVALYLRDQHIIGLKRIQVKIKNGISDVESLHVAHLQLSRDDHVQDLRFADEKTLVVIATSSAPRPPWLAYIPFRDIGTDERGLTYQEVSGSEGSRELGPRHDLSSESQLDTYITHRFDDKPPWIPGQLEINGRSGRRVIGVVASDRLRYRIFDMDDRVDASNATGETDSMDIEES